MAPTTVPDGDFDADAQMQRELAALVRARESPTTRRPRPRRRALRVESPPRGCRVLPFPTDPPPLSPLSVPQGDDDLLSDEESTLSIASIGSRPFTLDDTRTDDDDDDDRRRGGRPEGDGVFRRARRVDRPARVDSPPPSAWTRTPRNRIRISRNRIVRRVRVRVIAPTPTSRLATTSALLEPRSFASTARPRPRGRLRARRRRVDFARRRRRMRRRRR